MLRLSSLDATSGVDKYRAKSSKALQMLSLRDIFARTALASQWDSRILAAKIKNNWSELLGASSGQEVQMVGVENGILTVSVKNPTWRSNVMLYKATLIEKMNSFLGDEFVQDIVVANSAAPKKRAYFPRAQTKRR